MLSRSQRRHNDLWSWWLSDFSTKSLALRLVEAIGWLRRTSFSTAIIKYFRSRPQITLNILLYARAKGVLRVPVGMSERTRGIRSGKTHRLWTCMSSILVVFSIDLIMTRVLGVIGELASFKGLKLSMAFTILLAMAGRARIKIEREFRVASIKTASLIR